MAADDPRLDANVLAVVADLDNELLLSTASVWEMAIKSSLGKLMLGTTLERLVAGGVERGIRLLEVACAHACLVEHLPFHHRDPFDRLLVAQATHDGLHIVSRDRSFDAYAVTRVWDRTYAEV
jgi:PIN domain nuclease of toxin-antitoxin system